MTTINQITTGKNTFTYTALLVIGTMLTLYSLQKTGVTLFTSTVFNTPFFEVFISVAGFVSAFYLANFAKIEPTVNKIITVPFNSTHRVFYFTFILGIISLCEFIPNLWIKIVIATLFLASASLIYGLNPSSGLLEKNNPGDSESEASKPKSIDPIILKKTIDDYEHNKIATAIVISSFLIGLNILMVYVFKTTVTIPYIVAYFTMGLLLGGMVAGLNSAYRDKEILNIK